MKHNTMLTIASLLTIVLFTLHVADDLVRGFSPPGITNMIAVLIVVVWLYGTLSLAERRSGYIIMLVGGLLATLVPVLHLRGASIAVVAKSDGGFFFLWTLLAIGTTGLYTAILAARALWILRRGRLRSSGESVPVPQRSGEKH